MHGLALVSLLNIDVSLVDDAGSLPYLAEQASNVLRSLEMLDVVYQIRLREVLVLEDLRNLARESLASLAHALKSLLDFPDLLKLFSRNVLALPCSRLVLQFFGKLDDLFGLCLHARVLFVLAGLADHIGDYGWVV